MDAPRSRRRFWLPLLGTAVLSTAGGGGWAAYQYGWVNAFTAAAPTEDAPVAAEATPVGNDADRWTDEVASQLAASKPAETLTPPAVDPFAAAGSEIAPPTEEAEVDPLAAPLAALDSEEVAPAEVAADPDVARGQTPGNDDPLANPLRSAPRSIDAVDARQAFSEAQSLSTPPEPSPNTEIANPLRPQRSVAPVTPVAGESELSAVDPLVAEVAPLTPPPTDLGVALSSTPPVATLPDAPAQMTPVPVAALDAPAAEVATLTPPPTPAAPTLGLGELEPVTPNDFTDNSLRSTPPPVARELAATGPIGGGRPGEQALEGPQRPALVLQKFAPDEIQVGKECKFVVKVRNMGQRPADEVVVRDQIPHGAQLVATQPAAEATEGSVEWNLGTLSPGEERSLEMTLLPTDEGEIGSVASVVFSAHASAKTRCTRPQLALRLSSDDSVLVGRQQRVTIELHNPGTGDATGVMLLENVPDNVRHESGPALEFEVGTLRAGETRRLELVLTAVRAGQVRNILTARADGNLQVQQHVDFAVVAPGLAVDVEGPGRRYLERPATYTVKIENPGSAPAKDVQVVTRLPRGMKFVKANNLGEYDATTHSVYWSLAELPEGQTGSVELVALPMEPGDHVLEVESRAREGLTDATSQQVTVEGLPAIMFEVLDLQDPIEVGGNTAYEVRVVNQGTKAATNVGVRLVTPPGMRVVSATGETRHQIDAQGVTFEPVPRLAPKADTLFRIQLEGVQPGDQRVLVEVDTDDLTQPVRKEESTRVFGDE